ncbi:unnamed protein product [marine sediment metagenome]|uniref:Uncharacterized protein n=1 Tax=marine sediment metagenome TaxID=412755 RepID=X1N4E1_9ZZZZ
MLPGNKFDGREDFLSIEKMSNFPEILGFRLDFDNRFYPDSWHFTTSFREF